MRINKENANGITTQVNAIMVIKQGVQYQENVEDKMKKKVVISKVNFIFPFVFRDSTCKSLITSSHASKYEYVLSLVLKIEVHIKFSAILTSLVV